MPPLPSPHMQGCIVLWGVQSSWGIKTTKKRSLNQEDNQAPQLIGNGDKLWFISFYYVD